MSALRAAQERLWFLHQLDPADASYHLPLAMRVRGRLDRSALERALDALTGRHESLRTRVELVGGAPVLAPAPGGVPLETAGAAVLDDARDLVAAFVTRPFDLTAGPMLRCLLIDLGPDEHVLALVAHHIAADGWSLQVLRRDLDTLYQAYAADMPRPRCRHLPGTARPAPVGDPPTSGTGPNGWPASRCWTCRPTGPGRRCAAVTAAPSSSTSPSTCCAGWKRWPEPNAPPSTPRWSRRSRCCSAASAASPDVCLGTPVLGRDDPDLADHVGCFAETLVLRTDLSGDPTFRALLRAARRTVLGALTNAAPFERVVSALGAPRDRSRTPLFQAMMMHLRQDQDRPRLGDLDAELLDHPFDSARTDVSLDVIQGPAAAVGVLTVDSDLFDPGTAQRLIRRLLVLLDDAAQRPDTAIGDLRSFDDDERREALTRWNDTARRADDVRLIARDVPGHGPVHAGHRRDQRRRRRARPTATSTPRSTGWPPACADRRATHRRRAVPVTGDGRRAPRRLAGRRRVPAARPGVPGRPARVRHRRRGGRPGAHRVGARRAVRARRRC